MKKIFIVLPVVVITIIFLFYFEQQPVSSDTSQKNFVINQGESVSTIAQRLEKNQLVRNRYVFTLIALKLNLGHKLQAGLFKLSPSQSTPQIVTRLTTGGNTDYWLKIIEGQRLAELPVSFDNSLEGYIFPDSYLVPQDYPPQQIYTDIIKKNFDKKITEAQIDATNTQMSEAQIVALASILEREARTLGSKQMVAGVLLNRLKIGMALQLDTTVEYARDSRAPHPPVYWQPASAADVHIISAYNTYLHPGLPPGPICNPGTDSLYAAFHPTPSDYLYYLTGNDNLMHYAITLADHNANITKYLK
jgi:UPF0755 protein